MIILTIGQRMKERRLQLGINAETVAEKIGVSPATIYRYENGGIEKTPTETLVKIAEVLFTTPSWLMGWSDDPLPPSVSEDKKKLIALFDSATPVQQQALLASAEAFLKALSKDK